MPAKYFSKVGARTVTDRKCVNRVTRTDPPTLRAAWTHDLSRRVVAK